MKSGNLNLLEPPGPLQACNGTAFKLFSYHTEDALFYYLQTDNYNDTSANEDNSFRDHIR